MHTVIVSGISTDEFARRLMMAKNDVFLTKMINSNINKPGLTV